LGGLAGTEEGSLAIFADLSLDLLPFE